MFLEKFTCRQITICGALLASCAFIVSIFSPNVDILILTYGIIGGRSVLQGVQSNRLQRSISFWGFFLSFSSLLHHGVQRRMISVDTFFSYF